MVLNKLGTVIFIYANEWKDYCQENGIKDPYAFEQKIRAKAFYESTCEIAGATMPCTRVRELTAAEWAMMPTDEEKERFTAQEQEFIAKRIYDEIDYATFEEYCRLNKRDDLVLKYRPCESHDGQCSLLCQYYVDGGCKYEENI